MAEHQFTFRKKERLRHRKYIDRLFKEGISIHQFPITLYWLEVSTHTEATAQVLFAVPKRYFKHANKRNLIRRKMKEAYRLHKPVFFKQLEGLGKHGILSFVYNGKDALPFSVIQDKIILLLQRLKEIHEKTPR
jgi:ribonuclease P protein component